MVRRKNKSVPRVPLLDWTKEKMFKYDSNEFDSIGFDVYDKKTKIYHAVGNGYVLTRSDERYAEENIFINNMIYKCISVYANDTHKNRNDNPKLVSLTITHVLKGDSGFGTKYTLGIGGLILIGGSGFSKSILEEKRRLRTRVLTLIPNDKDGIPSKIEYLDKVNKNIRSNLSKLSKKVNDINTIDIDIRVEDQYGKVMKDMDLMRLFTTNTLVSFTSNKVGNLEPYTVKFTAYTKDKLNGFEVDIFRIYQYDDPVIPLFGLKTK